MVRILHKCKKQNVSSNDLGFTLIEIMLVIAVVGILAVVTIPKYNGVMNRYHLENSAQQIAGNLKYAKQLAMDQRKSIYIVISANSVQNYEKKVDELGVSYLPLGDALTFDSGVTFTYTGEQDRLYPPTELLPGYNVFYINKGFLSCAPGAPGSEPSAPVTIHLSKAGQTITIQIEPQTGYVSVY